MIRDYDKKIKYALDMYYQSQEILSMVQQTIESFNREYGYDLVSDTRTGTPKDIFLTDEELSQKINTTKTVLLTDLGRTGEFSLKYILLLKQMRDYPNQSFEEFNAHPLYAIADRASTKNLYKDIYGMDVSKMELIEESKRNHRLQPLHDFDYLFEMLGILDTGLTNDIYRNLELCVKSDAAAKSNLADWIKVMSVCFPQYGYEDFLNINKDVIESYKNEFDRVMHDSGDVFTRLRYLSNNPDNKQYSLSDMISLLGYLTNYTKVVHEANYDDLNKNVDVGFSKLRILDKKKEVIVAEAPVDGRVQFCKEQFAEEREFLDEIFSIDRVINNRNLQETIGLRTFLSTEEVKELLNSNYSDEALYAIITNSLSMDKLRYFNENGVCDVSDIIKLLARYDMDFEKVMNLDGKDLPLHVSLNSETLSYVKQIPKVYEYLCENPNVVKAFFFPFSIDENLYDAFRRISSLGMVQEHPSLIALLDYNQFTVSTMTGEKMPTADVIAANVAENIELFKGDPILAKLPIMLDAKKNKQIYELLTINGLEEESIDKLDCTIFCLPMDFVLTVTNAMESDNVSLVEDGNLSNNFYRYANRIRNGGQRPMKMPIQPFRIKNASEFKGFDVVKS